MNKFTPSMFESIKSALQKNTQTSSYKDILKLTPGNNYMVRLLPDIKNPDKSFFHYYSVGWTSFSTGQYISYVSPSTFGERDPVLETKYRILRNDNASEDLKSRAAAVLRSEKWLVNAYVIKDPTNSENENKVMIIRYGKQLHKIIVDAMEGEGAEDFGPRIFDLSSNGCNFIIKAEKQGDYPTYVSSKFSLPRAIEGLTDEKINAIYDGANDLTSVLPVKSFDEIQALLDEHFLCNEGGSSTPKVASVETKAPSAVVDAPKPNKVESKDESSDSDSIIDENKINELLNGFDDL
ncbi:MAG: hypothetical protein EBZ47_09290 [Chlamydiae bacterium]|nr:hypothetical protein [Chlamydiota bacterium]